MKRAICAIVALVFVAQIFICGNFFMPNKAYAVVSFSDVDSSHWAYNYITILAEQGVINGYVDGTFKPSGTITRAEFIKLIVCASISQKEQDELKNNSNGFEWYRPYYDWIFNKELYSMNMTYDNLTSPISRKEMAEILGNFSNYFNFSELYLKKNISVNELPTVDENVETDYCEEMFTLYSKALSDLGYLFSSSIDEDGSYVEKYDEIIDYISSIRNTKDESLFDKVNEKVDEYLTSELDKNEYTWEEYQTKSLQQNKMSSDSTFIDISDVDINTQIKINFLKGIGIITGYEDNSFKPDNTLTRAEVATIIYRYSKIMEV